MVDAWGCAHAVADGTKVGRDPRADLAVLHASVSSEHAVLKQENGAWRIVDNASRNGTEVNDQKSTDAALANGATIRLGDVKFYFWPESLPKMERDRPEGLLLEALWGLLAAHHLHR